MLDQVGFGTCVMSLAKCVGNDAIKMYRGSNRAVPVRVESRRGRRSIQRLCSAVEVYPQPVDDGDYTLYE